MKEITLKIPDKKVNFFMELINQLGFEVTPEKEIPKWQKNEVNKRLQKIEEGVMKTRNWEDAKKDVFKK